MLLSEQLKIDFLEDVYQLFKQTRSYTMSYDYLIDLIEQIKKLESQQSYNENAISE